MSHPPPKSSQLCVCSATPHNGNSSSASSTEPTSSHTIHDCGDFTKLNDPEYWMDPQTGMPRSKMTKTGAFARYLFPEEAKRIEELRQRKFATKMAALIIAEKLAGEVTGQGDMDAQEHKAKADAAETMAKAEIKQNSERDAATGEAAGTKESETAKQAGGDGTEGVKKEAEGDAASRVAGGGKNAR